MKEMKSLFLSLILLSLFLLPFSCNKSEELINPNSEQNLIENNNSIRSDEDISNRVLEILDLNLGEYHNNRIIEFEKLDYENFSVTDVYNFILEDFLLEEDMLHILPPKIYELQELRTLEDFLDFNIGDNYSNADKEIVSELINVIFELNDVSITVDKINLMKTNYQLNVNDEKLDPINIAFEIAKSSYELWAPKDKGGIELVELNYKTDKASSSRSGDEDDGGWGAWFAKTATADIMGGLAAAGASAYSAAVVASTGVGAPAAGLGVGTAATIGAINSSIGTGIMGWPDDEDDDCGGGLNGEKTNE